MKHFSKNFIAFTLSEMMIVLLILSVISAATLPAITSRDESRANKASQGSGEVVRSSWMYDGEHTKGFYFRKNENTDVRIGTNIATSPAQAKALETNAAGVSPLILAREYPAATYNKKPSIIGSNRSDIAFLDKNDNYVGKIAADPYGNLAIGKNAGYETRYGGLSKGPNLVIGTLAGRASMDNGNTIIGSYAGPFKINVDSKLNDNNLVVGSFNNGLNSNNVVMGVYSNHSTDINHNELVSIGAYAGYASYASYSTVNLGYYAGARPLYSNTAYSQVNIGSYAGYYSYANGYYFKNASGTVEYGKDINGVVNVGTWAGANQYHQVSDANQIYASGLPGINVGAYAGVRSIRSGNINIGVKAGSYNYKNNYATGEWNINVGAFAGYALDIEPTNSQEYLPYKNINIGNNTGYDSNTQYGIHVGKYSGSYNGSDRVVCIGTESCRKVGLNAHNSVFIGRYAGVYADAGNSVWINSLYSTAPTSKTLSGSSVFIGCSNAHSLLTSASNKKFCIGGNIPFTNNLMSGSTIIWNFDSPYWGNSQKAYQMLFIPGSGAKALSSVGFNNTSIFLYANYIVTKDGTMSAFSDRRLKENIVPTTYGIDKLRNVDVYRYNLIGEKAPSIGVMAQDLQKYYPNAVNVIPEQVKKGGYYSINPDWIIYSLAQSIKDVDKVLTKIREDLFENISKSIKLAKRIDNIQLKLNKIADSQKSAKKQLDEINLIISKMERK